MATDYGTAISIVDDNGNLGLQRKFSFVSGPERVGQAILSRWVTPNGELDWDQTVGAHLLSNASKRFSEVELRALESALESEAEADERVEKCEVSCEFLDVNFLEIQAKIYLVGGEIFSFVADVTQASVVIRDQRVI